MAVPGFQEITLPLLQIASDGGEHRLADAVHMLAEMFHLTEEERNERLPSGQQTVRLVVADAAGNVALANAPGNGVAPSVSGASPSSPTSSSS